MKQYEEVFFALVRTALWKVPLEVPEGFRDWDSVMKLAKSQAMTGLVADVLLRSPQILSTLPERFVARLQEIPLENMGVHTVLNNTLIMVVTRLREHGIEPVLLKGQGLASYYPVPQLRQCGDIDLYVGVENYEKAYELLEPVATEIDDRSCLVDTKHFHVHVGPVLFEIHRYADILTYRRQNAIYQSYASEGLSSGLVPVDFAGCSVNTPADDFNIYYVFNHFWHHFLTSGVGFRQICDLACLLYAKKGQYDVAMLEKVLNDLDAMYPWQTFGCIVVDVLGLPQEYFPFYKAQKPRRIELLLERIIMEGNFGQKGEYSRKHTKSYMAEKVFSLKCHLVRITQLLRVFPRHMVIRVHHMLIEGFRQVSKDITRKR